MYIHMFIYMCLNALFVCKSWEDVRNVQVWVFLYIYIYIYIYIYHATYAIAC